MGLLRAFHTVRHLKPVQVAHRLGRGFRSVPKLAELSPELYSLRAGEPQPRAAAPGSVDGAAFRFLGRRIPFSGSDRWHPPGVSPLWLYKLHYFQFLGEVEPARGLELIDDWIASNPAPAGVGWQPYPLSMRIREWIEWALAHPRLDPAAARRIVASLVHQTAALAAQLEFEHLANHLLENAISLCWAGASLSGPRSEGWLARGGDILRAELATQVLADGAHDERSPMYQAWIAEALLRLAAVARRNPTPLAAEVGAAGERAGRLLLGSLGLLTHPDGDYALVNDTALDEAPSHAALARRFAGSVPDARAGDGGWDLAAAGYMGWRDRAGGYLIFDAGDIAPDHNTAHAHADTLSFELSHRGDRVITDTGVFTYSRGPLRDHDRSTAAHNTLEIDGRNQSEVWAAHRCGRRARVVERSLDSRPGGVSLAAAYRGPGGPFSPVGHRRALSLGPDAVELVDSVTAAGRHEGVLRLHLAPGIEAQRQAGSIRLASAAGTPIARIVADGLDWEIDASPYHPRFGQEIERLCLRARLGFRDRLTARWKIVLA